MDLLKAVKRRSVISDVLYTSLNLALAIAIVLVIKSTESLVFAIAIVLLSKWRVIAVRPRYWLAHLQSNLVDTIVSIAFVVIMFNVATSQSSNIEQILVLLILTILYMIWLLLIKPRSSRFFMQLQAASAVFLGTTALFSISYNWSSMIVVFLMWLIGYGVARHSLSSYDEEHTEMISGVWGVVFAELGWLIYHWTVAYSPFGLSSLIIPRAALSLICISFVASKAYESYHQNKKIKPNDVLLPVLFTFSIIVMVPIVLQLLGADISIGL